MTAETWECARCCRTNAGSVICRRCGEFAHDSGDTDCTWETLPNDDASPLWLTQVCPHGLSRFTTA